MRGSIFGGLLSVVLLAGCGGVEADVDAKDVTQQEQAVVSCAPGYGEYPQWDCHYRGCGSRDLDVLSLYCCNESGCYNAGEMSRACGACR